jgi:elongation factor Ts
MQITAQMVNELRSKTGVGMMECKKALVAANGDMSLARETLQIAGKASAEKKSTSRIAAEGGVTALCSSDNKTAVIAEINCETDFVAREEGFKKFSTDVVKCALSNNVQDAAELLTQNLTSGSTVEATRLELVQQLGEHISIRRIKAVHAVDGGVVAAYLHGGGVAARIGVVVALDTADQNLAKDVAMHIAAMHPEYLSEAEVPAARIAKEKEILLAQAQEANAGKPADILEKIIAGKMAKFLKDITLLGQPFVKNPDQTIAALLAAAKAKVTEYVRYEVGEGIEKKTTDFVGEVMAQVKG